MATVARKKDTAPHAYAQERSQLPGSNDISLEADEDGGGETPEETDPAAKRPCSRSADPQGEASKPASPSVTGRLARVAHQQQHLAAHLGEMQDRHQERQQAFQARKNITSV